MDEVVYLLSEKQRASYRKRKRKARRSITRLDALRAEKPVGKFTWTGWNRRVSRCRANCVLINKIPKKSWSRKFREAPAT
ncbi:hypothetical protein EBZ38_06735 [bacterium]|nr:hypothetical protein [bacterium]